MKGFSLAICVVGALSLIGCKIPDSNDRITSSPKKTDTHQAKRHKRFL
ncbi:MAG: hypothetical protein P1U61_07800 [Legionellaceae bacterium]|nr:hypothetical protein [Legionellaceae bacterium]